VLFAAQTRTAAVNERLKAQDAKIDKVNAKVEMNRPAPQMAINDQ
jgi:hypothetical protein